MNQFVTVDTDAGRLRGIRFRDCDSFLGIPYAGTTAGPGRFAPPTAATPWSGTRQAFAFGDAAPQVDTRLTSAGAAQEVHNLMYVKGGHPLDGAAMSEDCLNLNVWTPEAVADAALPVMVWLHGGGFQHGSAGSALYHGDQLAVLGNIVVVTVNARLGLHGFLPLDAVTGGAEGGFDGAGNAGMLDIVAALQWVKRNIASFGGDPGNVTIFGQSGGGGKVNALLAMPAAHGLFHKAINMSGATSRLAEQPDAEQLADTVLQAAGLDRSSVWRLREADMWELLDLQHRLAMPLGDGFGLGTSARQRPATGTHLRLGWAPWLDGRHVTEHPFGGVAAAGGAGVPMLIGSTAHDTALLQAGSPHFPGLTVEQARDFADRNLGEQGRERLEANMAARPDEPARLAFARTVTDLSFRRWALDAAVLKSRQDAPVYVYQFDHPTDIVDGLLGAPHSLDLPFTFYNVDRSPFAGSAPSRHETSRTMALAWAAFAHHGTPSHADIPAWEPFTTDTPTVMHIDVAWHAEPCALPLDSGQA